MSLVAEAFRSNDTALQVQQAEIHTENTDV